MEHFAMKRILKKLGWVSSKAMVAVFALLLLAPNVFAGFTGLTSFGVGTEPGSVIVGRFNSDAFDDLAVANYISDNVSILLGKGDGTFYPQTTYPVGNAPVEITVGRFNSDAFDDLWDL